MPGPAGIATKSCFPKSYTCLINDVSVGFCYLLSPIRLPGGPDSWSPPGLWSNPQQGRAGPSFLHRLDAAVESLDRILAG